jgi:hypothetical protein
MQTGYHAGQPTPARRVVRLVALSIALMAIGAAVLLSTRWVAPLREDAPEALFSAGPYRAGDAFEQMFDAPVDYLSYVQIRIHTEPRGGAVALIFRLSDTDRIVREGVVVALEVDERVRTVTWEFDPLETSARTRFRLQVVVGEGTERPVFAMTDLRDPLPGSLVSNGVPSGAHVDLTLVAGRRINWWRILFALGGATPVGLVGLGALVALAGIAGGVGWARLRTANRSGTAWHLAWGTVGAGVAVVLVAAALRLVASVSSPEAHPAFWGVFAGMLATIAAGPWALLGIGELTGRTADLRSASVRAWLLAGAIAVTLGALAVLQLTEATKISIPIPYLDDGQPATGRASVLGQEPGAYLTRLAILLWIAYALLTGLSRRRRRREPGTP